MLVRNIHEIAVSSPNKIAIICNDIEVSYFAYSNGIQQMTSFLRARNLPADRTAVIVDMDPSVQWVVILAARSLGLNTVVVRSLEHIGALDIKDCACVVTPEHYQFSPQDILNIFPGIEPIVIADRFCFRQPQNLLPLHERSHQFGGHIVYTSGTTGAYKKVLYEGVHEVQRNIQRAKLQHFTQETVLQALNFGLWTGYGFRNPSAVWSAGGCVVLDRRVNWPKHFHSHEVNVAYLTPQTLKELLVFNNNLAYPNSKLTLYVGGGPLSLDLAERATRKLTTDLRIHYATTEIQGPILRSTYKSVSDLFWLESVLEKRVQVVNEKGDECACGQEGELRIELSEIDPKFYMDDEMTSAKFFRNGYFYPGDMATKREDGCIKILGRTADVINIQGNKTAVAPIELWIQSLLGADEVCVFSRLNDNGSEVLIIAVES